MQHYVHDGSWKTHPYINKIYIYIHLLKPSWPKAQCPNAIERDPICHLANTVAFLWQKSQERIIWALSGQIPWIIQHSSRETKKKHDFDFAPLGNRTILKYNSHTYSILALKDFYLLLATVTPYLQQPVGWIFTPCFFGSCGGRFIDLIHHKGCRALFINLWLHLWWYPPGTPLEARVCVNTEKSI